MTDHDIDKDFLLKTAQEKLAYYGWETNPESTTLTHPEFEKAKITISYSGGHTHVRGQLERHGTITEYWDSGNTLAKITQTVREIHTAIRNADSEGSTEQ